MKEAPNVYVVIDSRDSEILKICYSFDEARSYANQKQSQYTGLEGPIFFVEGPFRVE